MCALPRVLTHTEAQERARLISVSSYHVDLDLTLGAEAFGSTTVVHFRCTSPGAGTFIEIRPARLVSATLNGRALDGEALTANRLALQDLAVDNVLVVQAEMAYTSTGEGMNRFVDPADNETYVGAYIGVDNAQRVCANFDQPDLKATITTSATAPPEWTLIANGRGRRVDSDNGRWVFDPTPPLSSYLFVLVAGPWHCIHQDYRGIPFGLHCRRSLSSYLDADAEELFALTFACFDRYAEIFDEAYPFDSYDQAFVPGLNWGAMEMPGCITFSEQFVFRSAVTETQRQLRGVVIAHEMAHMWFGDLVTMRWWDDLWLSESFAEYMGFQVLAEATSTDTWTQFAIARKTWGYDADQRPSTHPVAPPADRVADTESALANFDGISYAKGASILRQLVAWLGSDYFLHGVNDFLRRHRFEAATLDDLLESLASSSGRDVFAWADTWLRTTGVDTLRLTSATAGAQVEHAGVRPHQLAIGLYDQDPESTDLVLRRRIDLDLGIEMTSTPVTLDPGEAPPTLLLLNDADLSYCKVRLDQSAWTALGSGLGSINDPLSRAVVWTAARDMVRDAELPAQTYLDLAMRHLPVEPDPAVVDAVLDFARRQVVDLYVARRDRPAALESLAATCRAIVYGAGGQTQTGARLAALRCLIECASNLADIGELQESLAANEIPDGPALDPDLRWRILYRLCILSAATGADIAAELAGDVSGSGPDWAAQCTAALATRATKEAAWTGMFALPDGEALSNDRLAATARGFWQPEQPVLLAPYVERYFPAAVEVAARRGAGVAELIGGGGFPFHVVEPALVRAAEGCLASQAPTPALRRKLEDKLDDVRRALRVLAAGEASPAQAPRQA